MAENKVRFLRGTAAEYANAVKDEDTFYYTTDDEKFYVGSKEISGGGSITIDNALSDTSENAVQNKVIKADLDKKASKALYGDTTINVGRKADTTIGEYSTAEGYNTTASGKYSHAEGGGATASGERSHAEGNFTTASGDNSHAEGSSTTATGNYSHVGGSYSTASGQCSFTHGAHAKATNFCEVAFGRNNISNSDTLFSIGDGLNTVAHNAFEITTDSGKLHDNKILTDAGDTMSGSLIAASDLDLATPQMRNIYITNTDLTAGTSALPTGSICFVYE